MHDKNYVMTIKNLNQHKNNDKIIKNCVDENTVKINTIEGLFGKSVKNITSFPATFISSYNFP